MLNDLILAQAAIGVGLGYTPARPARLSFEPLAPWMIEELRKRSERNRQREAPQIELPVEPTAPWQVPVKDWQD